MNVDAFYLPIMNYMLESNGYNYYNNWNYLNRSNMGNYNYYNHMPHAMFYMVG